jgi:hypothetical protein
MSGGGGTWCLPGLAVGAVGVLVVIAGFATGGPDAVDGVVFGGVALAAAAVMLWRRAPRRSQSGSRDHKESGSVLDNKREDSSGV